MVVDGPEPLAPHDWNQDLRRAQGPLDRRHEIPPRVDWGATFDDPDGIPADAIETAVGGAYSGMLEELKKHPGEG